MSYKRETRKNLTERIENNNLTFLGKIYDMRMIYILILKNFNISNIKNKKLLRETICVRTKKNVKTISG